MQRNLSDINFDYNGAPLIEDEIPKHPVSMFEKWYDDVLKTFNTQPNAMVLSTNGKNGFPQSRVVLLKEFSKEGFQFFTNYESQKGKGIKKNNKVALTFFWPELERQIRIEGLAEKTSAEISENYFNSRPIDSRISAIVSEQSKKVSSRDTLEKKVEAFKTKLGSKEPVRPENWGGYLVQPTHIEFWQGRPNRLHDRILYALKDDKWKISRLAP